MTNHTYTECPKCHATNRAFIDKIQTSSALCGKCSSPLSFHRYVSEVTAEGLLNIIKHSDLPVVVDFWAPWCGPCKVVGPIIEKLAEEYDGKIVVGKLNVDDNNSLAMRYNVMSIPTIKFFKGGQVVAEIVGAAPKESIEAEIQKLL